MMAKHVMLMMHGRRKLRRLLRLLLNPVPPVQREPMFGM
jgi:hypothetical protein